MKKFHRGSFVLSEEVFFRKKAVGELIHQKMMKHFYRYLVVGGMPDAVSGIYTISPAYDLLSVNVIMPEDTEEFALHY